MSFLFGKKQWKKDNPEKTLINQRRATAKRTKRMREDSVYREKINKRTRERLAFRKESEPGTARSVHAIFSTIFVRFCERFDIDDVFVEGSQLIIQAVSVTSHPFCDAICT